MWVQREALLPTTSAEAWSVLTDWERQARWMLDADRVEVVSSERVGPGVRLAVRTRLFGVPAFTERLEVVGWEPTSRLVIRHGGAVEGTGTWSLEAAAGGTRFVWTEEVRLRVPMLGEAAAWLYRPWLSRLMAGSALALRRYVIALGPVDLAITNAASRRR